MEQHLHYIYQYFLSPKVSWVMQIYEFARYWVEKDHQVTVITIIYSKSNFKSTRLSVPQHFNGIKVIIINVLIDNLCFKKDHTVIGYALSA